jgi:polysaccharide biosynthesis/export protein
MPARNQAISSLLVFLSILNPVWGQKPTTPAPGPRSPGPEQQAPIQPEVSSPDPQVASPRPTYVLAPMDQVMIRVPDAEEIHDRPFRIDNEGNLTLPLVGIVKASGLSVEQFESELTKKLKVFIRAPQVSVTVVQFRTDSILLTGSFARPGIYPLQPSRTLIEMLSSVGGLLPNASRRIRITRRLDQGVIPLENAIKDSDARVSTAEISLNRLMEASNSAENVVLAPYDVLYAGKAEMVYLNLEGSKAGAYPLDDREFLSVLQLLSLAGGLDQSAAPEKARVLRPILNTSRRAEIPVDVRAILEGRQNDYPLMANDLLMIPRSKSVSNSFKWMLPTIVTTLVTSLIFVAVR